LAVHVKSRLIYLFITSLHNIILLLITKLSLTSFHLYNNREQFMYCLGNYYYVIINNFFIAKMIHIICNL
jgi:hypothetical protein